MEMFMCFSPLMGRNNKPKGVSKGLDGGKKRSKSQRRVKPISNLISSSTEKGVKEPSIVVADSFPSIEKLSYIRPKLLIDDSFATEVDAYWRCAEHDKSQSTKGCQTKGELACLGGSKNDLNTYALNQCKSGSPLRLVSVLSIPNKMDEYLSDSYDSAQSFNINKNKPAEPQNEWSSFSSETSHMDRVSAWVNSLDECSFFPVDVEEPCDVTEDDQTAGLGQLESKETFAKLSSFTDYCSTDEVAQANNLFQTLNPNTSVARLSSIGLTVIPSISSFFSLRSVDLSGNCIAHITPGSLPKCLHTLDLSRNNISTIDGFRDLERLRVLNLSHNRISKVGHGLSACTLIKELYLAGNKISDIEGFHRLLKLTVLDLSFNRITSTKVLGQLAANFNSLLALNLIGNPIQANLGDDQLKKEVLSIIPGVTYLNKQLINYQKAREVTKSNVAKAALGDSARSPQRKVTRRLSQSSSSPTKSSIGDASFRSIKHRTKSRLSTPDRKPSSSKLQNGSFCVITEVPIA